MKDTREHILAIAFKLFLQKNFKEVTMKEIVDKTGLSKGAFYHYFNSKEQVFEEVMNHFFAVSMQQNFESYSHESLKAFCEDYIKDATHRLQALKKLRNEEEDFSVNHYFLLFDAMKMLPSYKQKLLVNYQKEVKSWEKIVHLAKKRGEIKTSMTDEQLAKMFIYISDGFGMDMIMHDNIAHIEKFQMELHSLWQGLYELLKA